MPPIKRHDALVQFSREHHFGLLLSWKIKQGIAKNIDNKRMAEYILAASDVEILPHFENEEKELFGLLAKDDSLRLRAEQEHASIRQKLKELKDGQQAETLTALASELDAHIRFEERELFPHIEQQQSFEVYAGAIKAHESMPHDDFDSSWSDHFWA